MFKTIGIVIFLLFFAGGSGFGEDPVAISLLINNLDHASPPQVVGKYLLFTYQDPTPRNYVGIRFEHEDYAKMHVYAQNNNHIYYLLYERPQGVADLKYRMVVDSIWMRDPFNPDYSVDHLMELEYSLVTDLPAREQEIQNPLFIKGRRAVFKLKEVPGSQIYIVGDFNNWDPFLNRLKEDPQNPGFFTITLTIPPGEYFYQFLINGRETTDPYNRNWMITRNGKSLSFFKTE